SGENHVGDPNLKQQIANDVVNRLADAGYLSRLEPLTQAMLMMAIYNAKKVETYLPAWDVLPENARNDPRANLVGAGREDKHIDSRVWTVTELAPPKVEKERVEPNARALDQQRSEPLSYDLFSDGRVRIVYEQKQAELRGVFEQYPIYNRR